MGWQERIKPAAYTSPSGVRLEFEYENVSKRMDKHTTAFQFPDADGSFVQSLGRSGRQFPLRFMISGDNYDLEANTFDAMLSEDGIGVLEHPVYGVFDVVPFGRVERIDELKTRGNQAIFNVTFYETNRLVFPLQTESASELLQASIAAYTESAPLEFEETIEQSSTIEKVSLRNRYQAVKDQIKKGLQPIADVQARTQAGLRRVRRDVRVISDVQSDIQSVFDTVNDSINDAIQVFISDPLALAFQTSILVQAPARSVALITARLEAYGGMLVSLTTNGTIYTPTTDSQAINSFRSDDMLASNLLVATALAVLNAEFETKTDALAAADTLLGLLDEFTVWRDGNLSALAIIDTGSVYQQVINAISTAAGFLVEISFSLKQERSVILVAPMTPIELEARFYRTIDENLDFLINSNAFVGEELLEVPIGRSVVYYA